MCLFPLRVGDVVLLAPRLELKRVELSVVCLIAAEGNVGQGQVDNASEVNRRGLSINIVRASPGRLLSALEARVLVTDVEEASVGVVVDARPYSPALP